MEEEESAPFRSKKSTCHTLERKNQIWRALYLDPKLLRRAGARAHDRQCALTRN